MVDILLFFKKNSKYVLPLSRRDSRWEQGFVRGARTSNVNQNGTEGVCYSLRPFLFAKNSDSSHKHIFQTAIKGRRE
jgi:hypothetical protein